MNDLIKVKPKNGGSFDIHYINGVNIGEFIKMEDGYYVWWPNKDRYGYMPAHFLTEVANKLNELNAEWDKIVKKDLATVEI